MELIVETSSEINGEIKAPPSKSYTHRAIIISSLAKGTSNIYDPLIADDTLSSLKACEYFGTTINSFGNGWCVKGNNGVLRTPNDIVDVGNSGTTLRIMTSVAGLAKNYSIFTGDDSLKTRPMQYLLDALKPLGVKAISSKNDGKPPIIVNGIFNGGKTSIKGDVSSQFISSILIAAPYAKNTTELSVLGEFISKPYVDMTRDIMQKFGVEIIYESEENKFVIEPSNYVAKDYVVEGDFSSASYPIAATAILGGELTIKNLFKDSKQGDKFILDIVSQMGVEVTTKKDSVIIQSNGQLEGIDVDLTDAPDLLPTVAALGSLADGCTNITGVEHARFKETDRIMTCAKELKKLAVDVTENQDGLTINGGVKSGIVKSHNDHRLVMALSLIGLKTGIKICDAESYSVSFPNYPKVMSNLGCFMYCE